MRFGWLFISLLLVFPSLNGCGDGDTTAGCRSNRECAPNQICLGGLCTEDTPRTPDSGCASDADCSLGEICDPNNMICVGADAGVSMPADTGISSPTQPDASQTSDTGMSMMSNPDAQTSTNSPDGGSMMTPDAGMGTSDTGTSNLCAMDGDCAPPNTICEGGQCVAGCAVPGGWTCGMDEVCDTNTGRCVTVAGPCTQDSECAPPMTVCESGQCVPGCGQAGGIQCGPGQVCELPTGRCAMGGPICLSDLDCNTPTEICELFTGACQPGCGMTGCMAPEVCNSSTGHCIGTSSTGCSMDMFEPNNDVVSAAVIQAGVAFGLNVCSSDEDFYKVDMLVGDLLDVTVDYTFGEGNVDLQLLDPSGNVLQSATSTTDVDSFSITSAPSDGSYAVRVFLQQDLGPNIGNNYGININHTPASSGPVRFVCSGTSCFSTPSPLPNSASSQAQWDPCPGQVFTWSAQGQFESTYDRGCVGGIATSGSSGSCSGGIELNGSGPWTGSASGAVTLSLATDSSVSSTGVSSIIASCGATAPDAGMGSTDAGQTGSGNIICAGTMCYSTPSPLPNSISDSTTWDPCPGRAWSWVANGQFETTWDRACVGGIASGLLCLGGDELNGTGPWTGNGNGATVVSIATDSSVSSTGLTSLVATCR